MGHPLAVRVAAAVLAAGAALTVTACSSGEDKAPKVAGDQDGQGKQKKPKDDAAVRQAWTQCMHDEGHTDIKVDEQGRVALPAAPPGDDQGAEAGDDMLKAMKKCDAKVPGMKQLQEKGDTEGLKQARGLVDCLRKNGMPDMADPDPKNGGAISMPKDFDQKAWNKAFGICGDKYPGVPMAAQSVPEDQK